MIQFWLMKSEPCVFSLDDLMERPNQVEPWDGVRNYQARNFICTMKYGDLAFFYHSNCKSIGIVGIVKIVKTAYVDGSAFDKQSPYFDAKSTAENPRWWCVDVEFVKKFEQIISLRELKTKVALKNCSLIKSGNRLSILPITEFQWNSIVYLST